MNEAKYIEQKQGEAKRDARRKYSWMSELPLVNDPLECVLLLGRLNEAISTLVAWMPLPPKLEGGNSDGVD